MAKKSGSTSTAVGKAKATKAKKIATVSKTTNVPKKAVGKPKTTKVSKTTNVPKKAVGKPKTTKAGEEADDDGDYELWSAKDVRRAVICVSKETGTNKQEGIDILKNEGASIVQYTSAMRTGSRRAVSTCSARGQRFKKVPFNPRHKFDLHSLEAVQKQIAKKDSGSTKHSKKGAHSKKDSMKKAQEPEDVASDSSLSEDGEDPRLAKRTSTPYSKVQKQLPSMKKGSLQAKAKKSNVDSSDSSSYSSEEPVFKRACTPHHAGVAASSEEEDEVVTCAGCSANLPGYSKFCSSCGMRV